ncbi:MAG TPA: laccase domain-containing protein, partial [Blastocatellia bacterium]|nr:laccase domain-containing protein [Blastocatellia bacterium]
GAVAAIHAGWRGTAGRITERVVADMVKRAGADPRTAIAALGPVACAECYEVGEDVIDKFKQQFAYWPQLLVNFKAGGKAHLDLRAANAQQLSFCGFADERVHVAPYCTMHNNDLFFSHRREHKADSAGVGRLLSVVGKL